MMRKYPDRPVRLELDLWFRSSPELREAASGYVSSLMELVDGSVLDLVTIPEIQYQAALVELPNHQALMLGSLQGPLSTADRVMRVRPQSLYTSESSEASNQHPGIPTAPFAPDDRPPVIARSEEHTSELQSLMRNSYDV